MKNIILLLAVALTFSSCYHVYYSPNTAHVPLLTEKQETRINALYTTGGDSDYGGGELQVAHAVSDNLALMLNTLVAGRKEMVDEWDGNGGAHEEKGNGSYGEIGGGYFKALDKYKIWVAEMYAGAGLGSVKNEYGYGDISKVNSTKLFLQPALGYKGDHFEVALSPRVSFINWKVKENKVTNEENSFVKQELNLIENQKNFVAFEPALILRGGGKNIKAQASLSFCFNDKEVNYNGLAETLNASLGISLNLHPSKSTKDN